jgi:UMF1 family MFS transporter
MDSGSSQTAEPLEDSEQVEPQYDGEDTRPTSRKELFGWYSYGFAAEVFAICAMGTCPLFLCCYTKAVE